MSDALRNVEWRYVDPWTAALLGPLPAATPTRLRGAAVMADMRGFSKLASAFEARHGKSGADRMSRVLRAVFSRMEDAVLARGGNVVLFAGDLMIACFPEAPSSGAAAAEGSANEAARALAAAWEIAHATDDTETVEGVRCSMRVAVGAGELFYGWVGVPEHGHPILGGPAMADASAALTHADSGDVVLAPNVHTTAPTATLVGDHTRLLEPPPEPGGAQAPVETSDEAPVRFLPETLPRQSLAGGAEAWLAEMRAVTVGFLNTEQLGVERGELAKLQALVEATQTTLDLAGGALMQCCFDDKGTTLVVAFGVGGHEGRPVDAVRWALALAADVEALGLTVHIGLATGRVFYGSVGGDRRRGLGLVGAVVNLAARLSATGRALVCDAQTAASARHAFHWEVVETRAIKGFDAPVELCVPRVREEDHGHPLVVRQALLGEILDALGPGETPSARVVVRAEPGAGKTALARAIRAALPDDAATLWLDGNAVRRAVPYHPLQHGVAALLGLPTAPVEAITAALPEDLRPSAGLLGQVLGVALPDGPATAELNGFVRAQATRELVVELLVRRTRGRRLTVLVDDAHWLDSATLDVLRHLGERHEDLALGLFMRPSDEPAVQALAQGARVFELSPLGSDDIAQLVSGTLGVRLSHEAVEWVHARSMGNTFFALELVGALQRAAPRGSDADGRGPNVALWTRDELAAFEPTVTVEGAVAQRLDRLNPVLRAVLKAASVLGSEFDDVLLAAMPEVRGLDCDVPAALAELEAAGVIEREPSRCRFHHAIIHAVVYGLLVESQRKRLHGEAAALFEAGADPERAAPMLAFHWSRSAEPSRCFAPAEVAWAAADRVGALEESWRWMKLAVDTDDALAADGRERVDPLRRARWLNEMGVWLGVIGDTGQERPLSERVLRELGMPAPTSIPAWRRRMWRALAEQLAHRLLPESFWRRRAPLPTVAREAGRAWSNLSNALYFRTEDPSCRIAALVEGANCTDAADRPSSGVYNWGGLGMFCEMLGLRRVADWYADRAVLGAEGQGEPRSLVMALYMRYTVYCFRCDWERAAPVAERLERLLQMVETSLFGCGPLSSIAFHDVHTGHLDAAREKIARLHRLGERFRGPRMHAWADQLEAQIRLARGEYDEAAQVAQAAAGRMAALSDSGEIVSQGVRATALARGGRIDEAQALVKGRLGDLLARSEMVHQLRFEGYPAPAEVALAARRAGDTSVRVEPTLVWLEKFAGRYVLARPRLLLLRGAARALDGDTRAAQRLLRASLEEARRLRLPWEEARAAALLAETGSTRQGTP